MKKMNNNSEVYNLVFAKEKGVDSDIKNSITDSALFLLFGIMEKVTKNIIKSQSVDPDYYDQMAGIAIGLVSTINQIENEANPVKIPYTPIDIINSQEEIDDMDDGY